MGNHEKVFGVCENKCFVEVRPKADTYGKNDVYNKNETYSKEEINTSLAGKAPSNHNHDDRYYTETEVNNLVNNLLLVEDFTASCGNIAPGGTAGITCRHNTRQYNFIGALQFLAKDNGMLTDCMVISNVTKVLGEDALSVTLRNVSDVYVSNCTVHVTTLSKRV